MTDTLDAPTVRATPKDNLIRSRFGDDSIELRNDDSDGRTLFGHFAVFNTFTKIQSRYEGIFLERVLPGTFTNAFADRRGMRVLFEHGSDPSIGNKPIAEPTVLEQDDFGARYEAEMFEAEYALQLLPALAARQLGASWRFRVTGEKWDDKPKRSDDNPEGLPERTINDVELYEFGPVTWGAYPDATAGVRSGTDLFLDRLHHDPVFTARFTERCGLTVVERVLAEAPDVVSPSHETPEMTDDVLRPGYSPSKRRALAALVLTNGDTP